MIKLGNYTLNKSSLLIWGLILILALSLAAFTLAVGVKLTQAHQQLQRRSEIAKIRAGATEDAIQEQCRRMNIKFGKLIPLEEANIAGIKTLHYYKLHPKEKAKALALANSALKAFQPDNCNVTLPK